MNSENAIEFLLYVAGDLPNSRRAISNLRRFCEETLPDRHHIEILDVFESPDRAMQDRVLMTPQLVVRHGQGRHVLVGDLADSGTLKILIDSLAASG